MRFIKILFKLILVLLLVFTFALEYNVVSFENDFSMAKFCSRADLLTNKNLDLKSIERDIIPFANVYVVYAKDTTGQLYIVFDSDAHKQIQALEDPSNPPSDISENDLAYLALLKMGGKALDNNATSPIIYLVLLFILWMIPTKKIYKPSKSRR